MIVAPSSTCIVVITFSGARSRRRSPDPPLASSRWSDSAGSTRRSCTWRRRPTTSTWRGRRCWTPAPARRRVAGRLCELISARLHRLPALRKRLANTRLGYTQPDWIDVDVDPADHCTVHHSGDLEAVAADVLARPLDRHRPLWEMHVVEGLPDGRTGMIMKLHHAVLDGPSGAELMVQLLDLEPDPADVPRQSGPLAVDPEPSRADLERVAWRRASRGAARAATEMRKAIDVWAADSTVGSGTSRVRRTRHLRCSPHAVQPADHRPADGPLHRDNARCTRRAPPGHRLDGERRRAGDHRWRAAALPPTRPRPARVAAGGDGADLARGAATATGGNQLSALITTLGTDIADPVERLAEVTRVTNVVKRRHDDTGLGSLVGLTDVVPPRTGQAVARLAGQLRVARWGPLTFNVVVSNVPGPDMPFYCNGAIVESAYPMGPITDWSAINVTVVSYRRTSHVRTGRLPRRRTRHRPATRRHRHRNRRLAARPCRQSGLRAVVIRPLLGAQSAGAATTVVLHVFYVELPCERCRDTSIMPPVGATSR